MVCFGVFFFDTWKMLLHCHLLCTVFNKKTFFSLMLLCNVSFSLLTTCKIFLFTTDFETFQYDIPWYTFLHGSCALGSWDYWISLVYSFHQIWKMFNYYFFKFFFLFPLIFCITFGVSNNIYIQPPDVAYWRLGHVGFSFSCLFHFGYFLFLCFQVH